MKQLPLFSRLDGSQRVLMAGAGGGFDVFCGLPLYFALRSAGKQVFLGNLTFSSTRALRVGKDSMAVVEVTARSVIQDPYFPEKYLCEWFDSKGEEVSLYCFDRTGYVPLVEAYRTIVARLAIDTVILIDGGTDSMMRGDEFDLGTPNEDIASLAAVHHLDVGTKILVCTAFGVDHHHRVCHANFLEAVAELTKQQAFLGAFSLLPAMDEVRLYREATQFVFGKMNGMESIVNSSVLAAIDGVYGDVHSTGRTKGSRLWINPLMAMYWAFELDPVARRNLYLDLILETNHMLEIDEIIADFRSNLDQVRNWEAIPL